MRTILILGLIFVLVLSVGAIKDVDELEYFLDVAMGTGEYFNPFLRAPLYVYNFSVDYSKLPWPKIEQLPLPVNSQRRYDIVVVSNETAHGFDPTTCPNSVAICYYKVQNIWQGELSGGKNYSGVSEYALPVQRLKQFVCAGNDTACVDRATGCYCPEKIPDVPDIKPYKRDNCPQTRHLCQYSEDGPVVVCDGNISDCQAQYNACSCGLKGWCTSSKTNTCINARDELYHCKTNINVCLTEQTFCFCGQEMIGLQLGCTASRHACETDGKPITCIGSFDECILKHDVCSCGS